MSSKKVLFVVAPKNFRDEEYFQPRVIIQATGMQVVTSADSDSEEATGTLGGKARIDKKLDKVKAQNFDAVIFVGGSGSKQYFKHKIAHSLLKSFAESGKVVAAICIAPSILANMGLLDGKKATSFSSEKNNLVKNGASWQDKGVVVDTNIVTAQGPEQAAEFGRAIVELLS
jgi:protease I